MKRSLRFSRYDSLEKRFWGSIKKTDTCWEWVGTKKTRGYGYITDRGVNYRAHRLSYILNCGKIGSGMLVLHRCDNAACVNPEHLFLGTQKENMHDMISKNRSGRFKLSALDVEKIRRLYESGMRVTDIASIFPVKQPQISKIVHRRIWTT